jgi:hypothetical protein
VTVLTLSEFGRRAQENGSGGVDHGFGNAVLVLGAGVVGARVHGRWPGLSAGALDHGDLAGHDRLPVGRRRAARPPRRAVDVRAGDRLPGLHPCFLGDARAA